MKSIRAKLMFSCGGLIGVVCIGIGLISYINAVSALRSNLGVLLPVIAEQTSKNIQSRLDGDLKSLESIAAREDIKNPDFSLKDKLTILSEEGERIGAARMGIVDLEGNLINTDGTKAQIKEREYFQKALGGESATGDPVVTTENLLVVPLVTPINNNGKVIGVLLETRDGDVLSEITNEIKAGHNGTAFMINKEGTSIANPDQKKVLQQYNGIEEAKTNKSLEKLAKIQEKMIAGKTGTGSFLYNGIEKFIGYAPVSDTGWSVAITMTQEDALSVMNNLKFTAIITSVGFLILGLGMIYIIANTMVKAIKSTSKHLKLLAEGNLSENVSPKYIKLKDEIGEMTSSMKAMQESLGEMIKKIRKNSSDIDKQSESLSSVTEDIADTTQNVTETIGEVAKGTNHQAEDLILITHILENFNNKLTGMVGEIQTVGGNSKEISLLAMDSGNEMNLLNQSVVNVSDSFKEFYNKIIALGEEINQISEITSLINDIAEQTNLLALNASIEAARAGEAGKGFSVVADEIGKLAEQAKVSSGNINRVISKISESTDGMVKNSVTMDQELLNQVTVIENSVISFKKIIDSIDEIIPKIETIQISAHDIEGDNNEIMSRIEGVSSISSEISASAEEISASSEEMSASAQEVASAAQMLNSATTQMLTEVERFKV